MSQWAGVAGKRVLNGATQGISLAAAKELAALEAVGALCTIGAGFV
jgi:hypothetical protein